MAGKKDPAATAAFVEFIHKYRGDIAGFSVDVLGVKPKRWQRELYGLVERGERRISVKAGHGVGKSLGVSVILLWSILMRYPQKGVVTAPTAPQLFDALFAELKSLHKRLPPALRQLVEPFSDRMELKADPDGSFISARTSSADKPEAMSGVHSRHVVLVADEAPGIPETVYEHALGSMSGPGALTILIGNPTRLSGYFYKTQVEMQDRWRCMTVSCLDPDLDDIVDKDFIEDVKSTYGEDSDQFRVRVLGEFPRSEMNSLIAADVVEAAMHRDIVLDTAAPLIYGLDVARSLAGDRSALCKRQGNVVLEVKSRQGNDLMETVGWVVNEAMADRPAEINVDTIGMGGGVADRLRELSGKDGRPAWNVRDVNVAEMNAMNPQAERLRDELWLTCRDWLNLRACRIPRDDALKMELSTPQFVFNSNGKYKVEGKVEMKRRLKRSPDLADSLCVEGSTMIAIPGGQCRIDEIEVGDEVLTPFGTARVGIVWKSVTETVTTALFSNGATLRGKGAHKVFTFDDGPVRLDTLRLTNEMDVLSRWRRVLWRVVKLSSIGGPSSEFKHLVDTTRATIGKTGRSACFIAGCGSTITALSRRLTTFITRMTTGGTTRLAISNACLLPSIAAITCSGAMALPKDEPLRFADLRPAGTRPPPGTPPRKVAHGTSRTASERGKAESASTASALSARRSFPPSGRRQGSARQPATSGIISAAISRTLVNVASAAARSWRTVIGRRAIVPVSVATAPGSLLTYNLTLDRDNAYYANGILVFNCLTFAGQGAIVGGRAPSWVPGKALKRGLRGVV